MGTGCDVTDCKGCVVYGLEEVCIGERPDEVVLGVDLWDMIPPAIPPAIAARRTRAMSTKTSQNAVLLNPQILRSSGGLTSSSCTAAALYRGRDLESRLGVGEETGKNLCSTAVEGIEVLVPVVSSSSTGLGGEG